MERTKKVSTPVTLEVAEEIVETRMRWRKLGGGSLRCRIGGQNRIIKPGEIFLAEASELPKSSLDLLECIGKVTEKASSIVERAKPPIIPVVYKLKEVKGGKGLWNLVDTEGKVLNEKPLTKESAEELLAITS
jgi:hypothetical protein